VELDHFARVVLDDLGARDQRAVAQADFRPGRQPEPLFGRLFHEVRALDENLTREM
jgi:hypothetical protein